MLTEMSLSELFDYLEGRGLAIQDYSLLDQALSELGLSLDTVVRVEETP